MKITDELLYQHAAEARDIWLDTLPDGSGLAEHRFSDAFELEIQKAVHGKNRRRIRFKGARQAAAVLLICLLGAGAWLGVDSGARSTLRHWAQSSAAASFLHRCFGGTPETPADSYRISWLPDGIWTASTGSGDTGEVVYESESGVCVLSFTRIQEGTEPPPLSPDGEAVREAVEINGLPGECYEDPGGEPACVVAWTDEAAGISFRLSSSLTKEETIRMAESVCEDAAAPQERLP